MRSLFRFSIFRRYQLLGFSTLVVIGLGNRLLPAAVTVVQDDFNNSSASTGATALPGTTWNVSGTATEASGALTLRTAEGSSQWSGSIINTSIASSSLNIFTQTVSISIREFSMASYGDQAAPNSRFRFGILPKDAETYTNPSPTTPTTGGNSFSQFYNNGNDGLAVNIGLDVNGYTTFEVRYKQNVVSATDPNIAVHGSNGTTLVATGFTATGMDFNVNALSWELIFYGAGGTTYTRSGVWGTTFNMNTWGDSLGDAAFIMGVQNMGKIDTATPTDSLTGYITASIGSLTITADTIPEPSRSVLLLAGISGLLMMRRRGR